MKTKLSKRIPKRYWLYGMVLLVLGVSPFWGGPRPREFDLRGTPESMGSQFGREARWTIRLLCRVYVKGFICGNSDTLYAARTSKAMSVWGFIEPSYQREIDALASEAGVDRAAILLGNSFIDLGYSAYGCRAVTARTACGLLHGHNLDWDSVGGLANWSISIIRRSPDDERFRTVTIGLPGLVGSLDVINEHGLALSLNQLCYGSGAGVEPVFIRCRRIAETCRTYSEARDQLLLSSGDIPFLVMLSSAREGHSGVFEPGSGAIIERVSQSGRVWAANTTLGPAAAYRTALGQVVRDAVIESSADLQAVLAHPRVMMGCNIYSVVFDYGRNRFYIASGRTPAAARGYRSYTLFEGGEAPGNAETPVASVF